MDRIVFKAPYFTDKTHPRWPCGFCNGTLKIDRSSFSEKETEESKKLKTQEDVDPLAGEWLYHCNLTCMSCKALYVSCGTGFIDFEEAFDEEDNIYLTDQKYYKPKYFYPALKIFSCPKITPEEIKKELDESFELFFVNPAAATTHIRIALEQLLNYFKVKRYVTTSGKRRPASNHERINLLPTKLKEIKEPLLAIKWLGNAGSHGSSDVTVDDVLDAFEIFEDVLKKIFDSKTDNIKKLVKEINKKKGPVKKKK